MCVVCDVCVTLFSNTAPASHGGVGGSSNSGEEDSTESVESEIPASGTGTLVNSSIAGRVTPNKGGGSSTGGTGTGGGAGGRGDSGFYDFDPSSRPLSPSLWRKAGAADDTIGTAGGDDTERSPMMMMHHLEVPRGTGRT